MTAQDRERFATLMLGLGETYGEPVSEARMEIYFRALEDVDFAAVNAAANIHVRQSKFFPRPSELREAIEGSPDDAAELAWVELLRAVRRIGYYGTPTFEDDAMRRAALEMFGGWRALCSKLPGEGPELLGCAKNFKALYKAYMHREELTAPVLSAAEMRQIES